MFHRKPSLPLGQFWNNRISAFLFPESMLRIADNCALCKYFMIFERDFTTDWNKNGRFGTTEIGGGLEGILRRSSIGKRSRGIYQLTDFHCSA
jgi:hypothetical protein